MIIGRLNGPISQGIYDFTIGSVGAMSNGLTALGVPQDMLNTINGFNAMPGGFAALMVSALGS
ncbi:hypothetical protein [Gordonia sputi]